MFAVPLPDPVRVALRACACMYGAGGAACLRIATPCPVCVFAGGMFVWGRGFLSEVNQAVRQILGFLSEVSLCSWAWGRVPGRSGASAFMDRTCNLIDDDGTFISFAESELGIFCRQRQPPITKRLPLPSDCQRVDRGGPAGCLARRLLIPGPMISAAT